MSNLTALEQHALVAYLVKQMRQSGGWAGETHIQKSLFFLKSMMGLPFSYDYVLYKHGPYSFDLHDDIGQMRANMILDIEIRGHYGPSFCPGRLAERLIGKFSPAFQKYGPPIDYIADSLSQCDTRSLERSATALYVAKELPDSDQVAQSRRINDLKPHISTEAASEALMFVEDLRKKAKESKLALEHLD